MSTIVGFTGTRHGMSLMQREAVYQLLVEVGATEVRHGDCLGADEQVNHLARLVGARRVLHPPSEPRLRAFCEAEEEREPKPYLARNQDIVDESEVVVAAPYQATEQQRGGTWKTVRMARRAGRPLAVVTRSGEVRKERWPG